MKIFKNIDKLTLWFLISSLLYFIPVFSSLPKYILISVLLIAFSISMSALAMMLIDATKSFKRANEMWKEWKDRYNIIRGRIICPADPYGEENWDN